MPALDVTLSLLTEYGYVLLFFIALIEGPIITVLGALLASQLLLNVFLVYIVVVFADLAGDLGYYAIGRGASRHPRWYKIIGIKEDQLEGFKEKFRRNLVKSLFVAKYTQTGFLILPAAGAARMPLTPFITINFLATLPKSLAFVLIGYFFGYAYEQIDEHLRLYSLVAALVVVLAITAYVIIKKRTKEDLPTP